MPAYDAEDTFWTEYRRLTPAQRAAFKAAVAELVEDIRRGSFRKGLRVKRFQRIAGAWEMTWADEGRALFRYGPEIRPGQPHIVWLRIGTHDIFKQR